MGGHFRSGHLATGEGNTEIWRITLCQADAHVPLTRAKENENHKDDQNNKWLFYYAQQYNL